MRVLVACEYSGRVRNAFRAKGHEAWSCDLLPSEDNSPFHLVEDVTRIATTWDWDLMIAHPPCTHLAVSGARWFKDKVKEQAEALGFVRMLMAAPIEKICIENPVSVISSKIRKPDQIIQPWQFGEPEFKATCLWLKGLPLLTPVNALKPPDRVHQAAMYKSWQKVHNMPPGPNRWKERSRTYEGVAAAMANQWGGSN
jgi:site-specific DNA-cytosine methylase